MKLWFEIVKVNNNYVVKTYEIYKRNKMFLEQSREFTCLEGATSLLLFKVNMYINSRG